MSYLAAAVGGIGFFAMSVLLLGIWPGQVLDRQIRTMSPAHPLPLTASEERGRLIYSREGCAYCHTQQVRYLHSDMQRFGAPTLAWETRFDFPHLWGTRRVGPDLAREGAVHPNDWHLAHLYSPRMIVPDSVMPAYPSLFDSSPEHPKQSAWDLLAYLQSLGRARELGAPEGETEARKACNCPEDEMVQMAFHTDALNTSPAKARRSAQTPKLTPEADPQRGSLLYQQNCAGCHGSQGGAERNLPLLPRPTDLREHEYSLDRLGFVLWNGVAGTAMPAWRDFPVQDLSAIAAAVRQFHTGQREPELPANIVELGAKVYAANCSQCHGPTGAGDGSAVVELRVAPTNFRAQRPSLAQSLKALRNGIEGTQMAPWTGRLQEAELSAVAYYIRTLYAGNAAQR
jgi:mono/diheme cytochrome c family protein